MNFTMNCPTDSSTYTSTKTPLQNNDSLLSFLHRLESDPQAINEYKDCFSLLKIVDMAHAHDWSHVEDEDPFTPNPVLPVVELAPPTQSFNEPVSLKKRPREEVSELSTDEQRFHTHQNGQWAEKFKELVKFRQQTGHCIVSNDYQENPSLIRWVKRQRYQYKLLMEAKASTMTTERLQALKNLGFVWDSQAAVWSERLNELKEFQQVHSHCNVSSSDMENPQLATWVKCQRRQYRLLVGEGKSSSMTKFRMQELGKLGFEWELRNTKRARLH
jgi:hypothetical protein